MRYTFKFIIIYLFYFIFIFLPCVSVDCLSCCYHHLHLDEMLLRGVLFKWWGDVYKDFDERVVSIFYFIF